MAFICCNTTAKGPPLVPALRQAAVNVRHCSLCHTFTESEVCATCRDPQRDHSKLAWWRPADQSALERTAAFKGLYFVLMGKLSPLDGIGPHDIGLDKLFHVPCRRCRGSDSGDQLHGRR